MDNVLTTATPLAAVASRPQIWTGRVLAGLVIAFLLFDAIAKLLAVAPVIEATGQLGYPLGVIRPLGALLALSTILYAIPRTQVVGALLLTAYLGGATASHVRLAQPFWFPIVMGAVLWAALCLRSPRVRAIVLGPVA